MQTRNPMFDQMAQMMTETAGAADGVRREAETVFRGQLQKILGDMELVTREEFEAVKEMASKAREENDRLNERLDALEKEAR